MNGAEAIDPGTRTLADPHPHRHRRARLRLGEVGNDCPPKGNTQSVNDRGFGHAAEGGFLLVDLKADLTLGLSE